VNDSAIPSAVMILPPLRDKRANLLASYYAGLALAVESGLRYARTMKLARTGCVAGS